MISMDRNSWCSQMESVRFSGLPLQIGDGFLTRVPESFCFGNYSVLLVEKFFCFLVLGALWSMVSMLVWQRHSLVKKSFFNTDKSYMDRLNQSSRVAACGLLQVIVTKSRRVGEFVKGLRVHRGERRPQLQEEAPDLPVCLCYNRHRWSWAMGSDRMNR